MNEKAIETLNQVKVDMEVSSKEKVSKFIDFFGVDKVESLFDFKAIKEADLDERLKLVKQGSNDIYKQYRKVFNQLSKQQEKFDGVCNDVKQLKSVSDNPMLAGVFYEARTELNETLRHIDAYWNDYLSAMLFEYHKAMAISSVDVSEINLSDINPTLF